MNARGNNARSQDIAGALTLLAGLIGLQQVAPSVLGQAIAALRISLTLADPATFSATIVPLLFAPMGSAGLAVLASVTLPVATVAVGAGLLQTRGRLAYTALRPDPSRLNPLAGLRRLFGMQALIGLLWPVLKLAVVVIVVQGSIRTILANLPTAVSSGFAQQLNILGEAALGTALNGAIALVALGALDILYRRWQFLRQARMSRKEVRDELRQNEGDPFMRSRIRGQQRRMARNRMMQSVPKARVVVVNPTHFAVALVYSVEMPAPKVVAKGADLIAQRIIEIAREHRIPVVPNPPLARALYRSVEVGEPVPSSLYQAVAEILAYVFSVRRRS